MRRLTNPIRPDRPPRQPHPLCEESVSHTETKLRSVIVEQGKLLKTQNELLKCHAETFKKVTSALEEHEHFRTEITEKLVAVQREISHLKPTRPARLNNYSNSGRDHNRSNNMSQLKSKAIIAMIYALLVGSLAISQPTVINIEEEG
ncbi:hypothetical protein RRG08_026534 [Elysia crispata]|uniref:Uncharacterized protein n=1 Tax=Elysia crispata TaxID=231223 RepID=A0AAE0Y3X2_9GAST|nr:hypothetical protein RRG08_026534 [Elysia crispata]